MTSFVNKLKEADELYQKGVRYLDETMLHNIKRFLVSDKKRFMVARVNVPYQVIGSIKKSLDTFEPKVKSKYGNDLRCLTWDQCADIVKTLKIISKLPGLMFLDHDKLEVTADDLELRRKITERMALNKNAKIIIFISPNTKGLCNLLKGLENNSYFDFDYSTTKVDLQSPNRVQKPPSLMKAVLLGDCDEVNLLIACGKNVNTNDCFSDTARRKFFNNFVFEGKCLDEEDSLSISDRYTPLHLAAKHGHIQVVDILLAHNANVNEINACGETPLHAAAENGQSKIVQALLDHGANFLPNKDGKTPLHLAVFKCHTEVVDILLARNANVNEINAFRETPLHAAAEKGQSKIVQVLLDHGANFLPNFRGETPLHLAVLGCHTEVVDILLARNANVNEIDEFGETPLHAAAEKGQSKIVQALLDHGANFLPNEDGETPLHLAIFGMPHRSRGYFVGPQC